MHDSVIKSWHVFSEPLEGRVPYLYVDVKQLVTAGVGNLADPVSLAIKMPWVDPETGEPVSQAEIRRQWSEVKSRAASLAIRHHKFAAPLTRMRMTDEGMDRLVASRLAQTERTLREKYFPQWDSFPADAQLACLSIAWAVGDGWPTKFPLCAAAVRERRWLDARTHAKIKTEGNPGVVPRNKANALCFENAHTVESKGFDRSVLHWPAAAPQVEGKVKPPTPAYVAPARDDLAARTAHLIALYAWEIRDADHAGKMADLGSQ